MLTQHLVPWRARVSHDPWPSHVISTLRALASGLAFTDFSCELSDFQQPARPRGFADISFPDGSTTLPLRHGRLIYLSSVKPTLLGRGNSEVSTWRIPSGLPW